MRIRLFSRRVDQAPPPPPAQPVAAPNPDETDAAIDAKTRNLLILGGCIIVVMLVSRACAHNEPKAANVQPMKERPATMPTGDQIAQLHQEMQQQIEAVKRAKADLEATQKRFDNTDNSASESPEEQNAQALADAKKKINDWNKTHPASRYNSASGGNPETVDRQSQSGENDHDKQVDEAHKALFAGNLYDHKAHGVAPVRDERPRPVIEPTAPVPSPSLAEDRDDDSAQAEESPSPQPQVLAGREKVSEPLDFDPVRSKVTWLRAGTVIEGVLTNALDGSQLGPVNVAVTKNVYIPYTKTLVVPQGSIVLGSARAVGSQDAQRLVTTFRRILTPGMYGYGIPLERTTPGLAPDGSAGLSGTVNRHYLSIFGSALAVGAIGALAQSGNSGSYLTYDPSVQMRNGISQSIGQSANRILDRFLQRLPTITIPKGSRVEIMLIGDLSLPIPPQPAGQEIERNPPPVPRRADSLAEAQQQ